MVTSTGEGKILKSMGSNFKWANPIISSPEGVGGSPQVRVQGPITAWDP